MFLFRPLLLASAAYAGSSWFSSEPEYAQWSHAQLRTWLENHSVKVPPSFDKAHLYGLVDANWHNLPSSLAEGGRQWSLDQYNRAQRALQHTKDDTFDQWDESRLRAFLLEHGVIAPSGPRENLILLARNKYRAYTDAAALYSSFVSGTTSSAYGSATDTTSAVSQCIGNVAAQATDEIARTFDDTKDYIYSTWDDDRLRDWLEDRGIIVTKSAHSRDKLIGFANDYYRSAITVVWESWSDSYIREWLVSHHLLKPSDSLDRLGLLGEMKKYYYRCTDNVWNTWSDSELKSWLVGHRLLQSDARKSRDDLVKAIEESYPSALDTIWGAWSNLDIRQWLAENGHIEGKYDVTSRDDLVDLINSKYPGATTKAESYLVWPDARLRAYLRERGINKNALPTSRPGLLQETRIRWVQSTSRIETIFARLKEIINSSVEAVEDKVARVLEVLSGHPSDVTRYASEVDGARKCTDMKKPHGWSWGSHGIDEAKANEEGEAIKRTRQSVDWTGEKVRGEGDEL